MPDPTIGQGYSQDIGYRYKPGQPQAEYYSQKTGQTFGSADQLASYVNQNYQGANANASNVFGVLASGYTPRGDVLNQIKNDLNSFQQSTFDSTPTGAKRAASSISDKIATEQGNYDSLVGEYQNLRKRLQELSSTNYQDTFNQLRQSSGITGIENDFANNQKSIRELPYVNRQNFGNAGVATEGQLQADTQQKGIPLEIQQGNLLDRLKLAQSFIDNSLKFKQLDSEQARQSLSDGLQTALETINLSRTHLGDLLQQQAAQQADQQKAQQFAYDNRVTQPFYEIGGTVFRTSDQRAAHNPQEYIAMGGKGDFSDVQKLAKLVSPIEVNPGNTLIDPVTGKTIYQAPFTPSKYTSGAVNSATNRTTKSTNNGVAPNSDITQYASDVTTGKLKLTSVPVKIRAAVSKAVDGIKANQNKYGSEFEARIDYDREIRELEQAIKTGNTPSYKTSEIINTLIADYGKYISQQEIAATIRNLLG